MSEHAEERENVDKNGNCLDCAALASNFAVGDRVRVTRPDRFGKPNTLPLATVTGLLKSNAFIRYDDDPADDPGYPEPFEFLEKVV